jgi:hypothetical protein
LYVTGGLMIYFLDKLTLGTSVLAIRTLTALHSHCTHHCALVEHKGRRAPPPKANWLNHTHTPGPRAPASRLSLVHTKTETFCSHSHELHKRKHTVYCANINTRRSRLGS